MSASPAQTIPFLPLSPNFNYKDTTHWEALSAEVERWLVSIAYDRRQPLWAWGVEIFWMRGAAACPTFPHGTRHIWNPKIGMVGKFIMEWMWRSVIYTGDTALAVI
ncbi:hypothetical protein ID866_4926 [Astraeus odoratus]|nr:hypothetical protein ID866_4926 [Astraeus odoratus]